MTTQRFAAPAPKIAHDAPHLPDSGELPPLLDLVPVAGPPAFVLVGFGAVLLLLLVPPLALLATLVAVALVVAATLVALGAILAAPFLLVHRFRGHRPGRVVLAVPRLGKLKVHRA